MRLAVNDVGEGPAVVLLHGVTSTKEYVVMGSERLLTAAQPAASSRRAAGLIL